MVGRIQFERRERRKVDGFPGNVFQNMPEEWLLLISKEVDMFLEKLEMVPAHHKSRRYTSDPSRIQELRDMEMPQTAGELSQFLHCCRWMSLAIPNFGGTWFRRCQDGP